MRNSEQDEALKRVQNTNDEKPNWKGAVTKLIWIQLAYMKYYIN